MTTTVTVIGSPRKAAAAACGRVRETAGPSTGLRRPERGAVIPGRRGKDRIDRARYILRCLPLKGTARSRGARRGLGTPAPRFHAPHSSLSIPAPRSRRPRPRRFPAEFAATPAAPAMPPRRACRRPRSKGVSPRRTIHRACRWAVLATRRAGFWRRCVRPATRRIHCRLTERTAALVVSGRPRRSFPVASRRRIAAPAGSPVHLHPCIGAT